MILAVASILTLLGLGLVPFSVAPAGIQFDVLALPAS